MIEWHRRSLREESGHCETCEWYPFEDVPRKLWIRFASEEEYLKKAADLAEELKYSDGKDSIIIYCTKENKRIVLPQSRNIRITPDILASLRAQYGIKNVETT